MISGSEMGVVMEPHWRALLRDILLVNRNSQYSCFEDLNA